MTYIFYSHLTRTRPKWSFRKQWYMTQKDCHKSLPSSIWDNCHDRIKPQMVKTWFSNFIILHWKNSTLFLLHCNAATQQFASKSEPIVRHYADEIQSWGPVKLFPVCSHRCIKSTPRTSQRFMCFLGRNGAQ